MVGSQHPNIYEFMEYLIMDHSIQRQKVARFETGLPPKPESKKHIKQNNAIIKAVKQYEHQKRNAELSDDLFPDDDSDGVASDSSYEFDEQDESIVSPKYNAASQKEAIEKNPQMKLLNAVANSSRL